MEIKSFNAITKEDLETGSLRVRDKIMTFFDDACNFLRINRANLYEFGETIYGMNNEQTYYALNFCKIYENVLQLYDSLDSTEYESHKHVKIWFKREIEDYPFNGKKPIEFIRQSDQKILEVVLYSKSLLTEYLNSPEMCCDVVFEPDVTDE
jgi:hypothetical protein